MFWIYTGLWFLHLGNRQTTFEEHRVAYLFYLGAEIRRLYSKMYSCLPKYQIITPKEWFHFGSLCCDKICQEEHFFVNSCQCLLPWMVQLYFLNRPSEAETEWQWPSRLECCEQTIHVKGLFGECFEAAETRENHYCLWMCRNAILERGRQPDTPCWTSLLSFPNLEMQHIWGYVTSSLSSCIVD